MLVQRLVRVGEGCKKDSKYTCIRVSRGVLYLWHYVQGLHTRQVFELRHLHYKLPHVTRGERITILQAHDVPIYCRRLYTLLQASNL